jgi:hypothetical protein
VKQKLPDHVIAERLLGETVRFVRDEDGIPIRGVVYGRWVTRLEWAMLRRKGVKLAPSITPAPARANKEEVCPCPGCGCCCCKWVGDGIKRCRRVRCVCTRPPPPVRLGVRKLNAYHAELVLRRGGKRIDVLGVWTQGQGWDFSQAGDAKARSLPAVISLVEAREERRLAAKRRALDLGHLPEPDTDEAEDQILSSPLDEPPDASAPGAAEEACA